MRILILSDHRGHSEKNSLYSMAKAIARHPDVSLAALADRADSRNDTFFSGSEFDKIQVIPISESFSYESVSHQRLSASEESLKSFDAIFLRLAWPIDKKLFRELPKNFSHGAIVNDPVGILKTSNKKYLLNFPEFTPDLEICKSWGQLIALSEERDIVLKPLESYGGKGIARIQDGNVWYEGKNMPVEEFRDSFEKNTDGFLAVPYLKNVGKGDKRIFVAGGKIIFSSLRLPQSNGWLCNVAQGGSSSPAVANSNERHMVETLSPILAKEGIFYFGLDTLVNNKGKRVISEINTLSIGGLTPNEKDDRMYLSRRFARLLVNHVKEMAHDK